MKRKLPRCFSVNLLLFGLFLWSAGNPAWGQTSIQEHHTSSPDCTANAGTDLNTCPQGVVRLSGTFGGGATGGNWNDGGAGGEFAPNANSLTAYYTPPSPNLNDSIVLYFTATGPCVPVADTMVVYYGTLPPLVLTATTDSSAFCGDEIRFSIKAIHGFTDISSLQFNLNWDPTQLAFLNDTATAIGGGYPGIGTFNIASGSLTYAWFDPSGADGEDLADSTELLFVTMKIWGGADSANVRITGIPVMMEAMNSQFCVLTMLVNHAFLSVTPIDVTCPADTTVYINAPPVPLTAGWPAGGSYTGEGVSGDTFNPMVAGLGLHPVTYTYTNANNCSNDCSFDITVNDLTAVICPANLAVCIHSTPFPLSGALPTGGVYTGEGVTAGVFDPAQAGEGAHDITYTYNSGNSCTYSITVHPGLAASIVSVVHESCTSGADGAIDLNVTGGTPNYSYDWSNNGPQDPDSDPQDLSGLTAGTYTVTVTDGNACTASISALVTALDCPEISGKLIWEADRLTLMTGIDGATVTLSGDDNDADFTGISGTYLLQVTMGSNFMVTPLKNQPIPLAVKGLTAADASRIQQHFTGGFPLTDPYKMIAADPNGSGTVSSEDDLLVQNALLGDPLAQSAFILKSWRFVPKAYVFPDPGSPWGFPEKINIVGISIGLTDQDFIGIKTGDVIDPADTLNHPGGVAPDLVWRVQDQSLQQDATVTAEFRAKNFKDLLALQFGIHFDPAKLEFQAIESIPGSPLQDGNFGLYDQSNGAIPAVMAHSVTSTMPDGAPAFRLRFKSLQSGGKLSDAMSLSDIVLPDEAYAGDYTPGPVSLVYDSIVSGVQEPATARFKIFQNVPNPFMDKTVIRFLLPEACEAQIRIYDVNGRLVLDQKGWYEKGLNGQEFRADQMSGNGVLYYELVTPYGKLSKKTLLLRGEY